MPGLSLINDFVTEQEEKVPALPVEQCPQQPAATILPILSRLLCAAGLLLQAARCPDYRGASGVLVQALLDLLNCGGWETLARRQVQHFGYRFAYEVGPSGCTGHSDWGQGGGRQGGKGGTDWVAGDQG